MRQPYTVIYRVWSTGHYACMNTWQESSDHAQSYVEKSLPGVEILFVNPGFNNRNMEEEEIA